MPAEELTRWDVHTHLIPSTVVEAGGRGGYGMSIDGDHLVTPTLRVPTHRITRPEALHRWLDDQHLSGALVSPPPPLYRPDLDDADTGRWVRLVNEGLAEACDDERLLAMAYLPAERPRQAAALAAALEDSFVGVTLGTDLGDLVYSDTAYDPLWDVLADRSLTAFIHPGECHDRRLDHFYLSNLVGNPYETAVAAAHLVFGDVMGRFPGLRVLLAHGGGVTASLIGRWGRGVSTNRPGLSSMTLIPEDALRRFWVDSLVHDPSLLRHVIGVFGLHSVMFGSDWPFPMGADSPGASLEGLTDDEAAVVLGANALTSTIVDRSWPERPRPSRP